MTTAHDNGASTWQRLLVRRVVLFVTLTQRRQGRFRRGGQFGAERAHVEARDDGFDRLDAALRGLGWLAGAPAATQERDILQPVERKALPAGRLARAGAVA